jgi:hypothetical protein
MGKGMKRLMALVFILAATGCFAGSPFVGEWSVKWYCSLNVDPLETVVSNQIGPENTWTFSDDHVTLYDPTSKMTAVHPYTYDGKHFHIEKFDFVWEMVPGTLLTEKGPHAATMIKMRDENDPTLLVQMIRIDSESKSW